MVAHRTDFGKDKRSKWLLGKELIKGRDSVPAQGYTMTPSNEVLGECPCLRTQDNSLAAFCLLLRVNRGAFLALDDDEDDSKVSHDKIGG